MGYQDIISQLIDAQAPALCQMADQIWDYAEGQFREFKSSQLQQQFLQEKGFSIRADLAGEKTAFIAEYGSGKPVIAFLGEFDALAGLSQVLDQPTKESAGQDYGHGCGHNLLGTAAVAAALSLKELAQKENLSGTIRYYGCPAEEVSAGKAYLVRDGYFDDCDIAITWHPAAMNMVMPGDTLASFLMRYTFQGIPAHAAASPHLGRSALDAVELMNVGANYLREHIIPEARIHYAITDSGGSAPNVVQAHAQVDYMIRAPKVTSVKEIADRVGEIAKGAAMMTGTTVDIRQVAVYSDYISNDVIGDRLQEELEYFLPLDYTPEEEAYAQTFAETTSDREKENQRKMLNAYLGKSQAQEKEGMPLLNFVVPLQNFNLLKGSTDVGDVSWVAPTGQIRCVCWASGTPSHSWQVTAQGKSSIARKGMLLAAKVMSSAAYRFLEDPQLVQQAHEAWVKDLGGETYPYPLAPDTMPEA